MPTAFTQRGVTQLLLLLILLISIPVTIFLVGKSQELRKKAAEEKLVVFTDVSGSTLPDKISNPNVYLKITPPADWSLSRANPQNPLIKSAYSQSGCPGDPQNYDNQYLLDNCGLGQLAQLSNERLMTFSSDVITQFPNARLGLFSNGDLIKVGEANGDLSGFLNRFSNDRLLNPQFPNHILAQLPVSRITNFPCYIQQQLGYICPAVANTPVPTAPSEPTLLPTAPPSAPPSNVIRLKEIKIQNVDTDGSTGGHETFQVASNFQDYFNKPIYWKLNSLSTGQTEAVRTVQVIFFDGTNYFPFTAKITLFSPQSARVQSSYGVLNQYDQPPTLISSNSSGAQRLLQDVGRAGNYLVTINEEDDGITIDFTPKELTELEAKEKLSNYELYYHRMLLWLLLDSFSTPSNPIDPWYAFCDHLDEAKLDQIGAEKTILANGEELKCYAPPPAVDQFYVGDPHARFKYKKISATVLVKMIETARLYRENKNFQESAKDFAIAAVPFLGPTINAIRNPGSDPSQVAQEGIINSVSQLLGQLVVQGTKSVVGLIASKVNAKIIIPNFQRVPAATYGDFGEEVVKARGRLHGLKSLTVKLVSGKVINHPNLRRAVLRQVGRRWNDEEYRQVVFEVKTIYQKLPDDVRKYLIPVEQIERVLTKVHQKGNLRVLPTEEYDALVDALAPYKTHGVFIPHAIAQHSMLLVRDGAGGNTSIHEAMHLIQALHKSSGYEDEALRMLDEGLTDWILNKELSLLPAFDQEVVQIKGMIIAMEAQGVDGTGLARIAALRGDSKYFLEWFESTVGNLDPRNFFANQYAARSAQGLILTTGFLNNPDTEITEGESGEINLDVPPQPEVGNEESKSNLTGSSQAAPTQSPTGTASNDKGVNIPNYLRLFWTNIVSIFK